MLDQISVCALICVRRYGVIVIGNAKILSKVSCYSYVVTVPPLPHPHPTPLSACTLSFVLPFYVCTWSSPLPFPPLHSLLSSSPPSATSVAQADQGLPGHESTGGGTSDQPQEE